MSRKLAAQVWQNYLDRRLKQADLEPTWIHSSYESIRDYAQGKLSDSDEIEQVESLVKSFSTPDGTEMQAFPGVQGSPIRIIHDGWKIGTPTWVFLGRAQPGSVVEDLGDGWVMVGRPIPPNLRVRMTSAAPMCFIAYHREQQMGGTTFTAGCVGPAETRHEIVCAVEQEKGFSPNTDTDDFLDQLQQFQASRSTEWFLRDGSWRVNRKY